MEGLFQGKSHRSKLMMTVRVALWRNGNLHISQLLQGPWHHAASAAEGAVGDHKHTESLAMLWYVYLYSIYLNIWIFDIIPKISKAWCYGFCYTIQIYSISWGYCRENPMRWDFLSRGHCCFSYWKCTAWPVTEGPRCHGRSYMALRYAIIMVEFHQ